MIAAAVPAQDAAEVTLSADRQEVDDTTGVLTATGHVMITNGAMTITGERLRLERVSGRGELAGPLKLQGPGFEVSAARATFDLKARTADLYAFTGRWGTRAQFAGERLRLGDDLIELEHATATPCMHPEPDLMLVANRFRYYPKATVLNFQASGVGLRAAGRDLVTWPELGSHVDEHHRAGFDAWMFPSFGFDAYQGFLTTTRFDFTFGEGSRGAIPIVFSSGRGISAGIEHALGLGPGDVSNAVRYETPWATGQGGLRVQNAYQWRGRDGSRYELAADYRANLNEQAVHRLPEASWILPYYSLGGLLSYQSEFRAGYLWEEYSNVQATRLRWAAPYTTAIWRPMPAWQTWVNGQGFANHYGFGHFVGGQLAWNHRQTLTKDLALLQTLETVRVNGQTPYIHDRLIGADRVRFGLDVTWFPALSTSVTTAWSRLEHQGPLIIEDLSLTNTYRWNCFAFSLSLRPLVWGVDGRFQALDF